MDEYSGISEIKYENSALASLFVIDITENAQVLHYQVEMIARNTDFGILTPETRYIDNHYRVYYNITSKVNLANYLKRNKVKRNDLLEILKGITSIVLCSKKLLLNDNSFIIDENYIYLNPGTQSVSMIYLPFEIAVDIDEIMKRFVLKLILELAFIDEEASDNYIQRIINCVKSEGFKILVLDKLIDNLYDMHSVNSILYNRSIPLSNDIDGSMKIETKNHLILNQETKKKVYRKGTLVIASLIQLLLASSAILALQYLLNGSNKEDVVATTAGIILICGAVDFFALRKLLDKNNMEEYVSRQKKEKKTMKTEMNNPIILPSKRCEIELQGTEAVCNTVLIDHQADNSCPMLLSLEKDFADKILITKHCFVIGRLKGQVDYAIANNMIGRVHAEITSREGRFFIKDLSSRNGTSINGAKLVSNIDYEIVNGDKVMMANCQYEFVHNLTPA